MALRILVTNDDGWDAEGLAVLKSVAARLGDVVVLAPRDRLYEKTVSNLMEVKARRAPVIAFVAEGERELGKTADAVFTIPDVHPLLSPILFTIPLQLMAYHIAVLRGEDVDQPRNLAKSVTVE